MIRSMTAFGRGVENAAERPASVEIRSVNNRFFDCTVRLPRALSCLEDKIREQLVRRGVSRGKVEVSVTIEWDEERGGAVTLDEGMAESYIAALKALRDRFRLADDISVMSVAQNRDLFVIGKQETDTDAIWARLSPVLDSAVDAFLAAREREGENLRRDLLAKLQTARQLVASIASRSEENTAAYREKLEGRLRQTLAGLDITLDEGRILTECAIFADKIAIDEELVRLESHFTAFEAALNSSESVGRRLDFLLQEMNREINTAGSKSNDAQIGQTVVDLKCLLEKLREQIQNIE